MTAPVPSIFWITLPCASWRKRVRAPFGATVSVMSPRASTRTSKVAPIGSVQYRTPGVRVTSVTPPAGSVTRRMCPSGSRSMTVVRPSGSLTRSVRPRASRTQVVVAPSGLVNERRLPFSS
ncbi:hypothetical protein WME73_49870 [Sorangium sp. So ce302]|uniref:hypothetical protein n=1 Tax=Sorangium sp. So ce302 TaxID=3133297 RepID=UPI003F639FF7